MFNRSSFATVLAFVLSTSQACLADSSAVAPTGVPEDSIAVNFPPDQMRAHLASVGVLYGINAIGEYFNVVRGGATRGSSSDGRGELFVDVDLEKSIGWKGGAVHANGFYIFGEGPTSERIGNIFAVSNVEALETVRLFELWFEQSLFADQLSVRIGQLAADSEFFISSTAGQFVNGTFGWPGVVASNLVHGGPAYPLAAPGVRVQVKASDSATFLAAVFNGSTAGLNADDPQRSNRHGTMFPMGDPALFIAEAQFKYDIGLPGTLKLGGWSQVGDAEQKAENQGERNYSIYGVVDQQIWRNGEAQSISVFARISASPDRYSVMDFYADAGIVAYGLVASRPKDSFGLAVAYGRISDSARADDVLAGLAIHRDFEAALELNYRAQIMPGWSVAPTFQYIWHPGGHIADPADVTGSIAEKDAAILGVRTSVSY